MIERHPVKDRAAWLAMRAQDLTASDLGAWAGADPYKSRLQLYGEKAGLLMPPSETNIMRRGRWLECAAIAALKETHPDWEIGYPLGLYLRDPEIRLGATPDAVVQMPGADNILTNCQVKVISKSVFERDWQDGPPLGYQLQTAAENLLMDTFDGMLAVLVIGPYDAELAEYPIPRIEAAEARIKTMAETFWDDVAHQRRPPADYERDEATVAALFPRSVPADPPIDLSGDNLLPQLLATRVMLKKQIKSCEDEVSIIDTEVKSKLGPADRATLPGWSITWKSQFRKEHVVPASTFRRLTISRRDEEEAAA